MFASFLPNVWFFHPVDFYHGFCGRGQMDYYSYPDFGSHFTSQVFRHSKYASAN